MAVETMGPTLGDSSTGAAAGDEPPISPYLFQVFDATRPAFRPQRHALSDLSTVAIGRGADEEERGDGRLTLRRSDRWMSQAHAQLTCSFGRWVLTDEGSKNGTRVGGTSIDRHELADGDLIEVGRSFFLFRRIASRAGSTTAGPAPLQTLSPSFGDDLERIWKIAATGVPVLLNGESGTGKEVVAREIHARSGRTGGFIAVNCGGLPATLVESELFGHKKGAFSGAVSDHVGLVRASSGGTLFLDEIGDLPAPAQAALLRVLQEREVRPVGATASLPVDLRLVSATHRDLELRLERDEFRADLFARIAGYRATLPSLSQRREDLGLLITALLARHTLGEQAVSFSIEAARALLSAQWPLNVRELDNCLSAAVALAGDGAEIALEHLSQDLRNPAGEDSGDPDTHRREVEALLREHNGNVSAVARAVGKDRKQVQRWLKRYQLDPSTYR